MQCNCTAFGSCSVLKKVTNGQPAELHKNAPEWVWHLAIFPSVTTLGSLLVLKACSPLTCLAEGQWVCYLSEQPPTQRLTETECSHGKHESHFSPLASGNKQPGLTDLMLSLCLCAISPHCIWICHRRAVSCALTETECSLEHNSLQSVSHM